MKEREYLRFMGLADGERLVQVIDGEAFLSLDGAVCLARATKHDHDAVADPRKKSSFAISQLLAAARRGRVLKGAARLPLVPGGGHSPRTMRLIREATESTTAANLASALVFRGEAKG